MTMIDRTKLPKGDWVLGSSSTNAFDPPRQSAAHAISLAMLLLATQRRRNEKQKAAEVGVWQGATSRVLLHNLPFLALHCIDPWRSADPDSNWYQKGDRFAKREQWQFDLQYELVKEMAEQFAPRCIVHRAASPAAADLFKDGELDLVFIDGAHTYEHVKADLFAWRPKVRSGGWLCAHDFRETGNYFGVIAGCKEATEAMGLTREVYPGKVLACRIP